MEDNTVTSTTQDSSERILEAIEAIEVTGTAKTFANWTVQALQERVKALSWKIEGRTFSGYHISGSYKVPNSYYQLAIKIQHNLTDSLYLYSFNVQGMSIYQVHFEAKVMTVDDSKIEYLPNKIEEILSLFRELGQAMPKQPTETNEDYDY